MPFSPSDRALGDLLVARNILDLPQLDEATHLAETWNVRLRDAVLARNWTPPDELFRGIAFHYDLPFVDLVNEPPDLALLRPEDADLCAGRLIIPWRRRDGRLLIATADPGPETVLFARQRWGAQIEFVVASKFGVVWAVQTAFEHAMSRRAVFELAELDPDLSAQTVFTPVQAAIGFVLMTLVLDGLAFAPLPTLIALNIAMGVFYLGNFIFKGILVAVGGGRATEDAAIAIAARALREDELPVFTILVPMFREPKMLPQLAQSLRALDYPLGKARHQARARRQPPTSCCSTS
jgi:glycosyltransferase XagB